MEQNKKPRCLITRRKEMDSILIYKDEILIAEVFIVQINKKSGYVKLALTAEDNIKFVINKKEKNLERASN